MNARALLFAYFVICGIALSRAVALGQSAPTSSSAVPTPGPSGAITIRPHGGRVKTPPDVKAAPPPPTSPTPAPPPNGTGQIAIKPHAGYATAGTSNTSPPTHDGFVKMSAIGGIFHEFDGGKNGTILLSQLGDLVLLGAAPTPINGTVDDPSNDLEYYVDSLGNGCWYVRFPQHYHIEAVAGSQFVVITPRFKDDTSITVVTKNYPCPQ